MTDVDRFKRFICTAFEELQVASGTKARKRGAPQRKPRALVQRRKAK
jgi:hypothetical protein